MCCCNNDGGKTGVVAKVFIDTRETTLEVGQLEVDKFIGTACNRLHQVKTHLPTVLGPPMHVEMSFKKQVMF